ncbi:MAG TPA: hypothetical protein VFJ58_10125 [Armatimonadota bacterium]|nr:hypothetical protein [Armatimonadota bacterium]
MTGLSPELRETPYCLVTCIDSDTDVRALLAPDPLFRRFIEDCPTRRDGALISTAVALEMARTDEWFTGFEEVWLFSRPPAIEKPAALTIVPPVEYTTSLRTQIELWMERSGAALGIAGGLGTNYATLSANLCDAIVRWAQHQALPSAVRRFSALG